MWIHVKTTFYEMVLSNEGFYSGLSWILQFLSQIFHVIHGAITLPPYLNLCDVVKNILILGYLYISRQNRVCIPIFLILTFDFVFSISKLWGCMVAISSPSPIYQKEKQVALEQDGCKLEEKKRK